MALWQVAKHLRHASRDPPIAAPPKERHVRSVVEESVWFLQFVEICDHLSRTSVQILPVLCGAIGFQLKHSEHVHVIYPIAGFYREAVGLRHFPLSICPYLAVGQIP